MAYSDPMFIGHFSMLSDPTYQGFAVIGPGVRVGFAEVVVVDVSQDFPHQVCLRGKVAPLNHAASQHTEPQLDLVQPTAMLGREMDHVAMVWVGQKRTPL